MSGPQDRNRRPRCRAGISAVSQPATTLAGVQTGAAPAAAAHGVVEGLLVDAVRRAGPGATVLDCGGGTGRFAVPLAEVGATLTVVDVSADALATLRRRAVEAGVADRVSPVQGDVESLGEVVGVNAFDLVLAHGILEVVQPLNAAFAGIVATLRSGGLLSVLVANPAASVLARAIAGDLDAAERELADLSDDRAPIGPGMVHRLCGEHDLRIEAVHGVGVFRDLVHGPELDAPGARETLARLEAACARRSPFTEIATRVHVLARRRGG
jgi:S-adenosylmethionine-dependent methyltransferase